MKRVTEKGRGGGYRLLHFDGDRRETPDEIQNSKKQVVGVLPCPFPAEMTRWVLQYIGVIDTSEATTVVTASHT